MCRNVWKERHIAINISKVILSAIIDNHINYWILMSNIVNTHKKGEQRNEDDWDWSTGNPGGNIEIDQWNSTSTKERLDIDDNGHYLMITHLQTPPKTIILTITILTMLKYPNIINVWSYFNWICQIINVLIINMI